MGTLIEISQNLASHSLISNLRSSHTIIACKKLSNLAGKKKKPIGQIHFGFTMSFHSGLSKSRIAKSPCAVSHSYYTGKTLAKSQTKLLANICGAMPTTPLKKQQKHHHLVVETDNLRHLHQPYVLPLDTPQRFHFCFPNLEVTTGSNSPRHYKVLTGGGVEKQLSNPQLYRSWFLKS